MSVRSFLNALTSTIGEEFDRLRGRLMTRLTAEANPETQIARGSSTLSSVDGLTLTLSAGTYGPDIASGIIIRLLSGGQSGDESTVDVVNNPASVTVLGPGFGGVLSNLSWEAVLPADTAISVESTLYFANAGELFLGGVRHRYTGRSATQFTGVDHWDGTAWVPGVSKHHDVLAVVTDYTRARSAIDKLRLSFFVETAQDQELTDIGGNHGRDRRAGMEDPELYRRWLRATMYSPWGTSLCLWQILDAIIGEGNWETFADFTSATDDYARIFVRRVDESLTDLRTRWILDGETLQPATGVDTVDLAETPLVVGSVTLADDQSERMVASGTGAVTADGESITGSPGEFPANILPGDRFEVLNGPLAGERGCVSDNVSTSALTLGPVEGFGDGVLSGASPTFAWRVLREATPARIAKPSGDVALEYPTDTGTAAWGWQGTLAEATGAALTAGQYTTVGVDVGNTGLTGYYRRQARIVPESYVRMEMLCGPDLTTLLSDTDGLQSLFEIHDGSMGIAAAFLSDGAGGLAVAFVDITTGTVLSGGSYQVPGFTTGTYRTFVLEKRGTGDVVLSVDGTIAHILPYDSFTASAVHELRFGCRSTANPALNRVRDVVWYASTGTDYWSSRSGVGTTAGGGSRDIANLGGIVTVGSVGKTLFVHGATARNAAGGTVNGEWEIESRVDANTARVIGRTKHGLTFNRRYPTFVVLPDDGYLQVPDVLGHSIEILTGPGAGVYPISASDFRVAGSDATGSETFAYGVAIFEVTGYPTGGFTGDGEYDWRLVPDFPADSGLSVEISDAGSVAVATLTLPDSLPITSPLPVLSVAYATVYSGHVDASSDKNDIVTPRRPAYLYDAWGLRRSFLLEAGAEGVVVDLDSLSRDAAGLHIAED